MQGPGEPAPHCDVQGQAQPSEAPAPRPPRLADVSPRKFCMFVRFFFLLRLQTECEGNVCGNVTSGFSRTSTSTPVTAAARRGPGRPRGTGDGALGRTRAPTLLSRSWAAAGAQLSEVPAGLGMKEELGTHALLNDRGGGEAGLQAAAGGHVARAEGAGHLAQSTGPMQTAEPASASGRSGP